MNLTPAQSQIALDRHRYRVVVAGRRFGKALDVETLILTPEGYKKLSTIKEGSFVFSEKGVPTKVLYKSPVYHHRRCYRVSFSDGASIVADASHDWLVETKKYRKNHARTRKTASHLEKMTTEEMSHCLIVKRNDKKTELNLSIPLTRPVVFKRNTLPIEPYFLGLWLGDGHTRSVGVTTMDEEIIAYLYGYAERIGSTIRISGTGCPSYFIHGSKKKKNLQASLRSIGVLNDKHIPDKYKYAPYQKRLELLRGLMDSDGYVLDGHCEYTTISNKLAEDVMELLWGMGIKAHLYEGNATLYGRITSKKYRIYFSTDIDVFSLTRKKIRQTKHSKNVTRRYITGVQEVGSRPVQCLMVDNPTHLFLAGKELIATHNTVLSAWEMFAKAVSTDDGRVTYMAPTFQQARDIAWSELKKVCSPLAVNVNESRLEITIKNNHGSTSQISLHGWESVESMRGQKYDMLVLDELSDMKDFWSSWQEVLRPALTDRRGEVLFIGTPKGFNALYELYNMENDLVKGQDYKSFHFTTYDNPHMPVEEIEKAKQEMTEDKFAQEYLADFRKTEGLVYKEFDRNIHIVDVIPDTIVETLGGVDFGYRNPTAILTVKKDYENRYYLSAEWYKTEQTEDAVVDKVASLKFNKVFPDPENASAIASLQKKGLNLREVSKGKGSIVSGIKKVREMFKQNRLFIHRSCVHTIQEIESYAYPDWSPAKNADELPIGKDNHAMDALRYVIMTDSASLGSDIPKIHYGSQRRPSGGTRVNINKFR